MAMQIFELKKRLADNPDEIIQILEYWEFSNVRKHSSYISCGREKDCNPNRLCIYFNNSFLNYVDFVSGKQGDLFSMIITHRDLSFFEVIFEIETLLGIETSYEPDSSRLAFFGGLYSNLRVDNEYEAPVPIAASCLDRYKRVPNLRFLKDGISLKAQKKFNIRYDIERGNIVIPIYSPTGYLMGVKARIDQDAHLLNGKYFAIEEYQRNKTLYGYSQNYEYLYKADRVYVFESEKAVMQAYSFGERRCVAMGGSFLSAAQAKLLIDLNPASIILAMDKGIEVDRSGVLWGNLETLQRALPTMISIKIQVLEMTWDLDVPDKWSPTDLGKEDFKRVIEEDLVDYEDIE